MGYKSRLDYMRDKLDEGQTRKGDVSDEAFEGKWKQILAASQVLYSEASDDVQHYEAERSLWHFYWGNSFPGKAPQQEQYLQQIPASPAARPSQQLSTPLARENYASLPPSLPSSLAPPQQNSPLNLEAEKMMMSIKLKLSYLPHLRAYQPMLGWNPQTGEPWLALRTANADKIVKHGHRSLLLLEKQILMATYTPFTIYYCKFAQYVLFWPEFKHARMLDNQAAWNNMSDVWTFLNEWVNCKGLVPQIDEAYNEWRALPVEQHQPKDFPVNFPGKWIEETNDPHGQTNQYSQPQKAQHSASHSGSVHSFSQQAPQFVTPTPASQHSQQQFQGPQQQQYYLQAHYQPHQQVHFYRQHNFQQPHQPQQCDNNHRPAVLAPRYSPAHRISKPDHAGRVNKNFSTTPRGPKNQFLTSPNPFSNPFSNQQGFRTLSRSTRGMGSGVGGAGAGVRNASSPETPNKALTTDDYRVVSPAPPQTPPQPAPLSPLPQPAPPRRIKTYYMIQSPHSSDTPKEKTVKR